MALPLSGPISISDINTEFNRSATAQTSLSQLYRGGGIVTTNNTNVPTSGAISLSNFYGAQRGLDVEYLIVGGGACSNADDQAGGGGGAGCP